jgi:hypothetical protein
MIMKIMKFFLPLLLLAVSCSNDNDKVVQTLDNEVAIVREVKGATGLFIFDLSSHSSGLYTSYIVPAGTLLAEFAKDGFPVVISGNITNNTIAVNGFILNGDGNETSLNGRYNTLELTTMSETTLLKGTKWKLAGIVDSQTSSLKELEPKECKKCYTLIFDTDSTFLTYTGSNDLGGGYIIDCAKHSFQITYFGGTKVCEIDDGNLYTRPFWKQTIQSFSYGENELRLHYDNGNNHLLFRLLIP